MDESRFDSGEDDANDVEVEGVRGRQRGEADAPGHGSRIIRRPGRPHG